MATTAQLTAKVIAQQEQIDKLKYQFDCALWCWAEFAFQMRRAVILKQLQQAGPELAQMLASGQRPPVNGIPGFGEGGVPISGASQVPRTQS